ncbi:MAG: SpoIVB peptidase [Oscillospiraceae bacterium]|nr:SpoIVB peptidase [Oscillospiraceae bacterium]
MKLKTISAFFLAALLTASPALAAEAPDELVPLGDVVGISVKSGGVEIAELSYIETESGSVSPAGEAGLEAGDVIVKAGARKVSSVSDIALALTDARGGEITVVYLRRGSERSAVIKPIVNNGVALIGIWAKDGISGIGTLTFFDPESGVFGALGHSVSEGAENGLYDSGKLHPARISGVVPGKPGAPGQLGGSIDGSEDSGDIMRNSSAGIFGRLREIAGEHSDPIPVASKAEISAGPAVILSGAGGSVKEYSIVIEKVYPTSDDLRSMLIRVTDEELIGLTGGIVQGMSGSPIIQNGKLVGAVTHVLVSDPTRGYGISIEEMLAECESCGLYETAA